MGKNTIQPLAFSGKYNIMRIEINPSDLLGII